MVSLALPFNDANSAEPEIFVFGDRPFISWLPQDEATSYFFQLTRDVTGEVVSWALDLEKACQATIKETGEAICGLYVNLSPGIYALAVSWKRSDGSDTEWYSSVDQVPPWKVKILDGACPPLDMLAACLDGGPIRFALTVTK